jgi:hypothetical protein
MRFDQGPVFNPFGIGPTNDRAPMITSNSTENSEEPVVLLSDFEGETVLSITKQLLYH